LGIAFWFIINRYLKHNHLTLKQIISATQNIRAMANINKNNRNRSKAYSQDEIAEVMEVLRMNDFNISETSRITKVSRVTLSKWRDEYHSNLPLQERLKQKENEIADKGAKFREIGLRTEGEMIDKVLDAKRIALDKIRQLLESETNLDRVCNALKLLEALSPSAESDQPNDSKSIFQQVSDQLIQMKKDGVIKS